MFEDVSLQFDQPLWLALLVLIIPAYLLARRSIGGLSPLKTHVTFALRAVVIFLLALSLARPTWMKQGEGLTVMVVLDRSRSVPHVVQQQALEYLRQATEIDRKPEDRLGIITVGGNAAIAALPNRYSSFDNFADNLQDRDATNLADGVSLALATAPQDTAIRFVLISDGNETAGHVLEAARLARANDIPIDVIPLMYNLDREVIFDRIVSPARAREGQVHTLRMVIRAQAETSGTLTLTQNGVPFDLTPGEPGEGIHISLQPGLNTKTIPIVFDTPGTQQFEARFEADEPGTDLIAENNSASAVTFVGGEGRVLIINDSLSEAEPLQNALEASDLSVEVMQLQGVVSLAMLSGYDAVILINQNAHTLTDEQDRWLHDYVHDLGGGLVMIGGPQAFGAGGWINRKVEEAMPVKFDPPQNMQRMKGALALIMHSCEMAQANFWGEKVAEAAINALSSLDIVGIIDYNWQQGGCVWEWGPDIAGDKSGPLAAAKAMPVGDMPDFAPSLQLAYDGLSKFNANRHCIIISDGDPAPPSQALLNKFAGSKITVTTVLIAGHGGPQTMQNIANMTGGRFYNVTNPRNLPEIFIGETRMIARSLVVEGELYTPQNQNPLAEPIRGFRDIPAVDGYVLTAPKEGLAEIPFIDDKNGDPIYANRNYGIGKTIAFTPDLTGKWGSRWIAWDQFKGFWDQSIRWAMRPVAPANMTITTRLEGERAIVEVEALESDESFLNFLQPSAAVLGPEGTEAITVRQVGPGRYRGEFPVDEAGSYLVSLSFRKDGEVLGSLQAAVDVPYAREFRDVKDNRALLYKVADETGGRDLFKLGDAPEMADMWNRAGLEARRSHKPIWDLLAIIAACIFLFDVAARRLSIGIAEMRKGWSRMVGRRGEVAEDTVAAWKKARSQVAHRRDERAPAPAQATSDVHPTGQPDRAVKFEASESDAGAAIDVGSESGEPGGTDRPATPKRREKEAAPPPDEGDFTSRLLAAKRRAREQQQGDGDRRDAQQ